MTSITTPNTIQSTKARRSGRSFLSFAAGMVLAGAVAVGVAVAADDDPATDPSSPSVRTAVTQPAAGPSTAEGCHVLRGPC